MNAENITIIVILLFLTTFVGSLGAIYLKAGTERIPSMTIPNIVKNWRIWVGIILYIISCIANIALFKFLPYIVAFPMTSLTYVWTVILSYFIFKEKITWGKIFSIGLIIIGVIIISR